ncbi:MEDS domain-containing protein [Fictibacillus aquaticus]|uniref:MEDS domain-containing protein n=1 Tax=Fictibacillus aquaticus TaxID=2021314 RepID=A0A235FDK2_9BACL|nr:MEDS domain-containing protein [Fictibacillus aquaticus]OYD59436.1 hypothetical protein CGZ90_05985 [Fictibacillus aquaticus]
MSNTLNQLIEDNRSVHVLYSYNGMKSYIEQAVSYIQNGVEAGDYIVLIENERNYRIIHKELILCLSKDEMKLVHYVNNFDFYYSSGSYHPPAIVDYFNKTVQQYVENKLPFRSWAHVEWATVKDPLYLIEELEEIVNEVVNELSFSHVCAYEAARMPDHLKKILLETHPFILMEDEIFPSEHYQNSSDIKLL